MAKKYVVTILLEGKDRNLKKSLQEGGVAVEEFADTAESGGKRIEQAFTGAAIAMTFGKSIPIMQKALGLFAEAQSATTSLGSAVRYSGEDFDEAQRFLEEYVSDGLIPLAQASVSLKNLLLAGYGLERSMEIMQALKDFAAFGRQGQLSMGEAVQRATEGLKNQMSQLVDNAGLTKNLSVMYREFARSIGKGAGSLTEAEKVTAVYLGVMGEWPAVHGDAERASSQLTGEMARQDARIRELYESVGQALEPAYKKLLGVLGPVTENIRAFALVNPEATATLLGGAGLVAAVGALAAAFALMGPGGALVVGVTAAILGIAAVVAKARAEQARMVEKTREVAVEAKEQAARIRELWGEYKELNSHTSPTVEDQERINELAGELQQSVPGLTRVLLQQQGAWEGVEVAVDSYATSLERVGEAALNTLKVQRANVLAQIAALNRAYDEIERTYYPPMEEKPEGIDYEEWARGYTSGVPFEDQRQMETYRRQIAALQEEFRNLQTAIDAVARAGEQVDDVGLDEVSHATSLAATHVSNATAALGRLFQRWEKLTGLSFPDNLTEGWEALRKLIRGVADDVDDTGKKVENFNKKLKRATQGWGDWGQFGVNAIVGVTDTFGTMLGLMMSGSEDITERLQELWGHFFEWIMIELGKLIAQLAAMQILKAIFPNLNLFGAEGGTVTRAAGGGRLLRAQGGGQIGGTVPGLDRYPVLAQLDETFLSTDLTRRIERMVSDYESSRMTPAFAGVGGAREIIEKREYNFTIVSPDAATFRRMIRSGEMGREIKLAEDHGKLPRR